MKHLTGENTPADGRICRYFSHISDRLQSVMVRIEQSMKPCA
jgi:hypothetical protein